MAFTATENFDGYANGNDINGKSGGSGWSANWVSTGTAEVTNAQAQSGTLSMLPGIGTNPYRDMTNVTVGSEVFYFYQTGDATVARFFNTGTPLIYLRTTTGNLEMYDGSVYQTVGTVSNNQWTKVTVELDQTNQPYKARITVDAQTPSAWTSRAGDTSLTGVDRFLTFESVYYDTIAPLAASGPANLKTYNTNTLANIKTINTNVIANVKTLDTNA